MTLLFQSLGFGALFGLVLLLANLGKPSKHLTFLKYFLIGAVGYFLYEWIMDNLTDGDCSRRAIASCANISVEFKKEIEKIYLNGFIRWCL